METEGLLSTALATNFPLYPRELLWLSGRLKWPDTKTNVRKSW